jgi:transposase
MLAVTNECGSDTSRLSRRIGMLRVENNILRSRLVFFEQTLAEFNDKVGIWHECLSNRENGYHKQISKLEERNAVLQEQNSQLKELLAVSKARAANLQKQIFGPKTETTKHHNNVIAAQTVLPTIKRKRGKQPGTPGFGRTVRTNLPPQKVFHELPLSDRCCKQCGKEYNLLLWTKDSQEIDFLAQVIRLIHKRHRYRKACQCPNQRSALVAPVPPKLIPKGLFSTRFLGEILIEKYLLQRPVNRILKSLSMRGLKVSSGTIIGCLKHLNKEEVFDDMNEYIKDRNRCAPHWHLDETGWKVFEEIEGKKSYQWWLWVSASKDTAVYMLDPGRGKSVPETYFAEVPEGIVSCDRLKAYFCLKTKFKLAYCWSHARRDFIEVRNGFPEIAPQAHDWVERINDLFEQNKKRCLYGAGSKEFVKEEKKLRALIKEMERIMLLKLADPTLHPELAKALTRLKNHWEGHMVFLEHSEIPMDNNEAERKLRNPVVGRKNYYGSGSQWSGEFAAKMMTILETIDMNGLDVRKWLNEYLEACAKNGGKQPDNVQEWLPWNMSPERKAELAKPTNNRK